MINQVLGTPGYWLIETLGGWLGVLGALVVATLIVRALAFPLAYRQAKAIDALSTIRDEVAAVEEVPDLDEQERRARQVSIYQRAGVGPFTPALAAVGQGLVFSVVAFGAARLAAEIGGHWQSSIEEWAHGWWWVGAGALLALAAGVVGVLRLGGRFGFAGLIGVSAFPAVLVVLASFLPAAVTVTTIVAAAVSLAQAVLWWWLIGPVREARPRPDEPSQ